MWQKVFAIFFAHSNRFLLAKSCILLVVHLTIIRRFIAQTTLYHVQTTRNRTQGTRMKFSWEDSLGLEMLVVVVVLPCFLPICSSYCINYKHNFINSFFKNYFILTIKKKTTTLCKSLSNPCIFDIFSPDNTTSLSIWMFFFAIYAKSWHRFYSVFIEYYSICFDFEKIYLTINNRFKKEHKHTKNHRIF